MIRFASFSTCAVLTLASFCAHSYELGTHAFITKLMFAKTQFGHATHGPMLIANLGFQVKNPDDVFGTVFYDVYTNTFVNERIADNPAFPPVAFENDLLRKQRDGIPIKPLSLLGWIARGAVREDDVYWNYLDKTAKNNPQDDLCTTGTQPCYRVLHHFFDPYNNRALAVQVPVIGGVQIPVERSPDWALGVTNAFAQPNAAKYGRSNHFSVADARESMWRALTLKRSGSSGFEEIFPSGSGSALDKENVRNRYWATVFRSLGSVIHHIQDMAQPQHTRVDAHAGATYAEGGGYLLGHKSFYELYVDARATGEPFNIKDSADVVQEARFLPLTTPSYDAPRFTKYSDYWSTSPGTDSLTGRGMADYSSRGFYTAGTNIGSGPSRGEMFPQPSQIEASLIKVIIPNPVNILGEPQTGKFLTIVKGSVADTVTRAPDTGVNLSSEGIFDQFLVANNLPNRYTLTSYNYDDQARLLIPRAIAYSAGLIDYFFRGKLQIGVPSQGVYGVVDHAEKYRKDINGFSKLIIKVANLTAPITPPGGEISQQEMTGGKLVAVVKFHRNTCYTPDLAHEYKTSDNVLQVNGCRAAEEEIVVSNAEPAGTVPLIVSAGEFAEKGYEYTFVFPSVIPINATDLYLQVAYRGPLGQEADAVAVATKDIPEPTYFSVVNVTDYVFCYNDRFYYRAENKDYFSSSLPYPPAGQGETIPPLPPTEPTSVLPRTYDVYRLAFGANSVGTPLATARVGQNEHARVAVLTDFNTQVSRGIDGFGSATQPTTPVYAINQVDYAGGAVLPAVAFQPETLRNVRSHYPKFAYLSGGSGGSGGSGDCTAIPSGVPGHQHPFGTEPGYGNVPALVPATISAPFN